MKNKTKNQPKEECAVFHVREGDIAKEMKNISKIVKQLPKKSELLEILKNRSSGGKNNDM